MYTPEHWKVIEFEVDGKLMRKVFATWRGGYTSSDNWQLNSGIIKTDTTEDYYDFHGTSGSVYRCYKHNEGITGMWLHAIFTEICNKLNAKEINYEN
jgi:hypothetical protein